MRRLMTAVAGLALVALPTSALAVDVDAVRLSNDGVRWHDSLTAPLFDPARRWVPGDAVSASFYVRNDAVSSARVRLDLTNAEPRTALAAAVVVQVRVGTGRWRALSAVVGGRVTSARVMVPGGRTHIAVRAGIPFSAANPTQAARLPLALDVTLVDARAGGGGSADQPGGLPLTGNPVAPTWIFLAAAACALGAGLVRRSTRDPEAHDERHHHAHR